MCTPALVYYAYGCYHGPAIARTARMQNSAQAASNIWTKPTALSQKSVHRQLVNHTAINYSAQRLKLVILPREGRRPSRPGWLVTYRDGLPAHRWPPIHVLAGPNVHVHCAT